MISGVLVPEIVEEINDAYDDLLLDIGRVHICVTLLLSATDNQCGIW